MHTYANASLLPPHDIVPAKGSHLPVFANVTYRGFTKATVDTAFLSQVSPFMQYARWMETRFEVNPVSFSLPMDLTWLSELAYTRQMDFVAEERGTNTLLLVFSCS
jgi:hypothetical protein